MNYTMLDQICTNILADDIPLEDIPAQLAKLHPITAVTPANAANLILMLRRWINHHHYNLIQALLEALDVSNFDELLVEEDYKRLHHIDSSIKHLRHYLISELFKTVGTAHYQSQIFSAIINKFNLAGIDFLQLFIEMPKQQNEALSLVIEKAFRAKTKDIRNLIPYMVEYFSQPTGDLEPFLALLNHLKNQQLIDDDDLTHLVKSFVLNEQQQVQQLALDAHFVQSFIQLIASKTTDPAGINSKNSYSDLVQKIIQRLMPPNRHKTLAPWVSHNLAIFIKPLTLEHKLQYLNNAKFLETLFSGLLPSNTIKTVLEVLLPQAEQDPLYFIENLLGEKCSYSQYYIALEWAIDKLPSTVINTATIEKILAIIQQQPSDKISYLYLALITKINKTTLEDPIWQQCSEELLKLFKTVLEQAISQKKLVQLMRENDTSIILFSRLALLKIWLSTLSKQIKIILHQSPYTPVQKVKQCQILSNGIIKSLDNYLQQLADDPNEQDLKVLSEQFHEMLETILTSPISSKSKLKLMLPILAVCKKTTLFQHSNLLKSWLEALIDLQSSENSTIRIRQYIVPKLTDLFEETIDYVRSQNILTKLKSIEQLNSPDTLPLLEELNGMDTQQLINKLNGIVELNNIDIQDLIDEQIRRANTQISKLTAYKLAAKIKNRVKIKIKGPKDFSNAAYPIQLFGLLGFIPYITMDRTTAADQISSGQSQNYQLFKTHTIKEIMVSSKIHTQNKQERLKDLASILNRYTKFILHQSTNAKPLYEELNKELNSVIAKYNSIFKKLGRSTQFLYALYAFRNWLQSRKGKHNIAEIATFLRLLNKISPSNKDIQAFLTAVEQYTNLSVVINPIPGTANSNSETQEPHSFAFLLDEGHAENFDSEQTLISRLDNFITQLAPDRPSSQNVQIKVPDHQAWLMLYELVDPNSEANFEHIFAQHALLKQWFSTHQTTLQQIKPPLASFAIWLAENKSWTNIFHSQTQFIECLNLHLKNKQLNADSYLFISDKINLSVREILADLKSVDDYPQLKKWLAAHKTKLTAATSPSLSP